MEVALAVGPIVILGWPGTVDVVMSMVLREVGYVWYIEIKTQIYLIQYS